GVVLLGGVLRILAGDGDTAKKAISGVSPSPQELIERGAPAVLAHVDALPGEGDALLFQPRALAPVGLRVRREGQPPAATDHAVPWYVAARRQAGHHAADEARASPESRLPGDLAVGRDPPGRDAADHAPDNHFRPGWAGRGSGWGHS